MGDSMASFEVKNYLQKAASDFWFLCTKTK